MVLLEAALVLPLLLVVALAGLGVARLAVDELAVVAAARDAALAAARGEDQAAITAMVRQRLGQASVAVVDEGDRSRVDVAAATEVVPWLGGFSVRHAAAATAAREPGL
jgi:Flp pilus assembly protein TadG